MPTSFLILTLFSILGSASAEEGGRRTAFDRNILATHVQGAGRYALAASPVRVRRTVHGFRLADDLSCGERDRDEAFCSLARPKPWTEEELEAMAGLLGRLRDSGLGRFLRVIQSHGFDTLLRESSVTHLHPKEGWRPLPYPNSLHSNRRVVVADGQFRLPSPERSTLHLLAHAYDFGDRQGAAFYPALSDSDEFLRMTGFRLSAGGRWEIAGQSPAERDRYLALFDWKNRELLKLEAVRDPRARRRKELAVRQAAERYAARSRVPSFHSLLNPYEAFAEWTAFTRMRPAEAARLNPELAHWIEEKVLRASPARIDLNAPASSATLPKEAGSR